MSAAVLKLSVHSYSRVWLLAAELSMVFSGAGRMRTTRRSWATREATTEPAKASNHSALHVHNNTHPQLPNKESHCMMKWMTLSEACHHANAKGVVDTQSRFMHIPRNVLVYSSDPFAWH